jgi:hypothetical protein
MSAKGSCMRHGKFAARPERRGREGGEDKQDLWLYKKWFRVIVCEDPAAIAWSIGKAVGPRGRAQAGKGDDGP